MIFNGTWSGGNWAEGAACSRSFEEEWRSSLHPLMSTSFAIVALNFEDFVLCWIRKEKKSPNLSGKVSIIYSLEAGTLQGTIGDDLQEWSLYGMVLSVPFNFEIFKFDCKFYILSF